MSEYWSATSGTVLVFPKEEVRDFFTRYLLETYRKDGVTDKDIDFIDCTISEYGSDSFYFLLSTFCVLHTDRAYWKYFILWNLV